MKIALISDTHMFHTTITPPAADILIHCGDFTNIGSEKDVLEFSKWFGRMPYKHKLLIAGNHDHALSLSSKELLLDHLKNEGITYLENSSVEIDGIKFFGSPITPAYSTVSNAFTLNRLSEELINHWNTIPEDTNVLITHGPPNGIMDITGRDIRMGCEVLSNRLRSLKKLKLHCFGHNHEGYGLEVKGKVTYVNASTCSRFYNPSNPPIIVEL